MYSYSDIGDYEIIEKLGSGSFGSVFKARHKITKITYAIKVIDQGRLAANNPAFNLDYIRREVEVLKKLSHPNIVSLVDYALVGDHHILAMEYCSGPTLDQFIGKRRLGEETTKKLLKQLASGLKYMWSKNIIHRDLKPQNILFSSKDDNAQLKIIDFGFSRMRSPNLMTSMVGTPIYMAPELLKSQPYSSKSDLWSIGCIMYEMLTGTPAFTCNMYYELTQLHESWAGPSLPSSMNVSVECKALLAALMCADPTKRIDWNDFFTHPFISSPHQLAESLINVSIEPISRNVTLNTRDLDPTSLVSVLKAHLLADTSDNAEKYDGVAALVEGKDGSLEEMLDHNPISTYLDKMLNASTVYLVLPLDKDYVPDVAAEPLTELLANSSNLPVDEDSTVATQETTDQNGDTGDSKQLLTTLHADFADVTEELRESVRFCRKTYETCRELLEHRDVQFKALQASIVVLGNTTKGLTEMSVSFKKTYKEPQEEAIKLLPKKVEANIEELRKTTVQHALPGIQGKSLLDCVGEDAIRSKLAECQGTLVESHRLMESFDLSLKNGHFDSRVVDFCQKEQNYFKQNLKKIYTELKSIEERQEVADHWAAQVDEHLSGSGASWLGFSFADPLREALTQSRKHLVDTRASLRKIQELAGTIAGQSAEMWPMIVPQFRAIAQSRTNVFSAMSTLHVLGEQYYGPTGRVVHELEHLPEVAGKMVEMAAQVLLARQNLESNARETVRNTDEVVQVMRTGVLDKMKGFRHKFEKEFFAQSFVSAVDALAPPPARVTLQGTNTEDPAALRGALAAAQHHNAQLQQQAAQLQQQNAQLRADLQARANELGAMSAHGRELGTRLVHEQNARKSCEQRIRLLEEQLRRMQTPSNK